MKKRILALLFMIAGVCSIGGGAYVYIDTLSFLDQAKSATGTVVEIAISSNNRSGKKEKLTLRPIIEYPTAAGEMARFKSAQGSNKSPYSVGDQVPVLYDPTDPTHARIDSFVAKYGLEALLSGLGAVFLGIGVIAFLKG